MIEWFKECCSPLPLEVPLIFSSRRQLPGRSEPFG